MSSPTMPSSNHAARMATDEYADARERWTWKNQVMDGGAKILSPLRIQHQYGWCCYFALVTTMEPNLRVQWQRMRNKSLSISHLRKLDEDSVVQMPNEGVKIKRLLKMIRDEGVFEEEQYEAIQQHRLREEDARKYKITRFSGYNVTEPEHIRRALHQLRRGGPLVAVIRISRNYNHCYNSGHIYRFDPNAIATNEAGNPETHAVCVIWFVLEAKVPCLECQDSRGARFGRNGFLLVDITSIK